MPKEKVLRIQADKLANILGYPPNTYFEVEELELLEQGETGSEVAFRGKNYKVTPALKAAAHIILHKIKP